MEFGRELETAREAALFAGGILERHYDQGTRSWEKSADNPVTLADLEADAAIHERLSAAFPDDAILSEESEGDDSRLAKSRVWIVDPMDGTKEFTRRLPEFAVSIALALDGEPVVGVVHNPLRKVTAWASRGGGAYRNGLRTHMSGCTRLADATALVSRSESDRGELAVYGDWFAGLEAMGSIAWKLALLAGGDFDFNFSVAPKNEWDVCAGDLLVRESGGLYADFAGERRRYNQRETWIGPGMAAGNPSLFERFSARSNGRCRAVPGPARRRGVRR